MTAQARFRTTRAKLAPRWLLEGEGELVGYALEIMRDAFVERVRQGLMVRFPYANKEGTETGPSDALVAMGRDRRVVRGLSETESAYATHLIRWLDDRKAAGNPFSLMQKLAEYTGPLPSFRTVDNAGNWFSRAADGTESVLLKRANWDWDGAPSKWSRFWVIIYPNGLWVEDPDDWGDAGVDWGEIAYTWGSTATREQVNGVRGIVADWKPAGTRCVNVILALDPASFDPLAAVDDAGMPNGLWEHWSKNVAGVQVPARLSTARYWAGVR